MDRPSRPPRCPRSPRSSHPPPGRRFVTLPTIFVVVTLLTVLAVTVLGATGLAAASPQPYPLCGPCYGPSGGAGENVTVVESNVDVHLHANGSATWLVKNRLEGDGVEHLREDDVDLQRIVETSAKRHDIRAVGYGGESPREVRATLDDDDVMTVEFRDPGAATSSYGDALVVSYFRFAAYNPGIVVNADRFTMTGPEGYILQSGGAAMMADDHGSVSNDAVSLHGEPMAEHGTAFFADADLVYVPDDAHVLTATLALFWIDRGMIVDNLLVVFGPGILLSGLLAISTVRLAVPTARAGTLAAGGTVGAVVQLAIVIRIGDLTGFHQIWPAFTLYYTAIGLAVGVIVGGVAAIVARFGPAFAARYGPATLRND